MTVENFSEETIIAIILCNVWRTTQREFRSQRQQSAGIESEVDIMYMFQINGTLLMVNRDSQTHPQNS